MNTYKNKLAVIVKEVMSARNLASASMFCVTSVGLFGYTGGVQAAGGEAMTLEEVVVTARRREESIQDVPVAVTAMSEDFLRVQNVNKIEDLGTKVPSLRISSAGASQNEPIISLRGQRPAERAFNQDQAVPIYINDIVIAPTQGSNLGMYDLQNVQVLKGPQGTLFGRNSTGGAILMSSKRPGSELGGYVNVKVGDYNLTGFEGAVDVPITDNLQVRIAAHKLDRDGYQENVADNALNGDDYSDEHSQGARISVNFDQGDLNNLLVLAQDENRVAAAVLYNTSVNSSVGLGWAAGAGYLPDYSAGVQRNIANNDPWEVETDIDSEEDVKNTFVSNTTEFEVNDAFTVKNIFGYRKVNFETATDVDGTAFAGWGTPTLGAPGVTTDPLLTELQSEFYSDEVQLLGSAFDDRMEWVTGLYWSKTDGTEDYVVQQAPGSYDTGISTALNTSYGVFGEATWHFSDQWSVTSGARQSWDERELTLGKWTDLDRTNCNVTGPGGTALATCERTVKEDFDAATWRASLNYNPMDGMLVYASASTGYRAGGFNTRGRDDGTLMPFEPELVTTYELGNKADWELAGMAVRTNVALYWQDYTDIHQTRSFDNNGTIDTRTENAGKAVVKGAEFELTLLPTDNLQINFSYSYVDGEYKDKTDTIGGVEVDTTDSEFTYIPEQSLTLSTTYTLPVPASVGEMSLMASVYWQDTMYTHALIHRFSELPGRFTPNWTDDDIAAATDFSTQESYEVWNLRFDWRSVMGSNFDLAAYVNNAGDEQYVTGGLNVIDSGGYGGYMYGAPRTLGASMRYTF
ncbi:TonB-dependent receptor [Aestuariicella hydrocarbonica]|uniref:TonB-dependent receptor n=1 Tax=Pseudomaricurvus hydrocarbonicus TaxID=1470433 RepID=A0A9E5JVS6_9GAMM|nr:TonB-dependent receptor [Aestuariicella hydrocarbonica]NHO65445.1 TonB-dependent receptor [Aestuariicella hydrocarbonica]